MLLFLDFHKAFDMVDHNILLQKLSCISVTGNFLHILRSYLIGRTQCVKIGTTNSSMLPISSGVPQGSILAPVLFQVFINDLLHTSLNSNVHAYADDTTYYISGTNSQSLETLIASDIGQIERWCYTKKMVINAAKSHYLVVNSPTSLSLSININGNSLEQRETSKLLGLTLNDSMTWTNHIQTMSNKISSNLRLFYNIRHLMNFNTARQFYYNFIHSYLIYGLHLYYPMTPIKHTDILFKLQKRALRLICKDSASPDTQKTLSTNFTTTLTNILPLPNLMLYFTSLSAHRILNGDCPSYLSLPFTNPDHPHSTRYQYRLISSASHNKLNLHLLKTFNSLPIKLRSLSLRPLKAQLKSHYLAPN